MTLLLYFRGGKREVIDGRKLVAESNSHEMNDVSERVGTTTSG